MHAHPDVSIGHLCARRGADFALAARTSRHRYAVGTRPAFTFLVFFKTDHIYVHLRVKEVTTDT